LTALPAQTAQDEADRSVDRFVHSHASHLAGLDGVRGLAICLVLLYHYRFNPLPGTALGKQLQDLTQSGWCGVDLFFVLSGFLITRILVDTVNTEGYFRVFYARRVLRIFPLYYGLLFVALILTQPLQIDWHNRQYLYLAYLQNTGIDPHAFGRPLSPMFTLNHLWSLAVEEQFYLAWPLVVWWVRNERTLLMITGAGAAAALLLRVVMVAFHVKLSVVYLFTACRADSLLCGAALALALRAWPLHWFKRWPVWIFWGAMTPLVIAAWRSGGSIDHLTSGFVSTIGFTLLAVAFAAVVALAADGRSMTSRLFRAAPLRWLGRRSYGVYILHLPVLAVVGWLMRGSPELTSHLAALAATLVLAWLSFRYFETPILKLKRKFEYRTPPAQAEFALV
jgi:peptidoglycan/LPS O-acetylase OafA/YrhL